MDLRLGLVGVFLIIITKLIVRVDPSIRVFFHIAFLSGVFTSLNFDFANWVISRVLKALFSFIHFLVTVAKENRALNNLSCIRVLLIQENAS